MKHNISMIEYETWYGTKRIALFDNTKISEKAVQKAIQEDDNHHPDIIFCTETQYLSVFSSLFSKKKKEEEN